MTGSPPFVEVAAIAGCLIPGDGVWPSASDLAVAILEAADLRQDWATALSRIVDMLPESFAMREPDYRSSVLRRLETEMPDDFAALVTLTYCMYYSDNRVLEIIESITGYPARPPQPLGHSLPSFETSILRKSKRREPFWRRA